MRPLKVNAIVATWFKWVSHFLDLWLAVMFSIEVFSYLLITCSFLCHFSTPGCLPTLVTIPVWIGLYRALSNVANEVDTIKHSSFRHSSFCLTLTAVLPNMFIFKGLLTEGLLLDTFFGWSNNNCCSTKWPRNILAFPVYGNHIEMDNSMVYPAYVASI